MQLIGPLNGLTTEIRLAKSDALMACTDLALRNKGQEKLAQWFYLNLADGTDNKGHFTALG